MRVMGFNGSPRKRWNTATLLQKALEGVGRFVQFRPGEGGVAIQCPGRAGSQRLFNQAGNDTICRF